MLGDTMCHRRSARVRSSTDEESETEDAPGWWGTRAADRLRSLVAGDRGDESRERPASEGDRRDRTGPEADPTEADDAGEQREEPVPADD